MAHFNTPVFLLEYTAAQLLLIILCSIFFFLSREIEFDLYYLTTSSLDFSHLRLLSADRNDCISNLTVDKLASVHSYGLQLDRYGDLLISPEAFQEAAYVKKFKPSFPTVR